MNDNITFPQYFVDETGHSTMKIVNKSSLVLITSGKEGDLTEQSYVSRSNAEEEISIFLEEPDMNPCEAEVFEKIRDHYVNFNKRLIWQLANAE